MGHKTKVCKTCGKEKYITEYHKAQSCKNGRKAHCKSCVSIQMKNKRDADILSYRKRERETAKRNAEQKKLYRSIHRERENKKHKEARKGIEGIKDKIRRIVRTALQKGTLYRLPCEICGAEPAHAHHEDYNRPLEVKWLCVLHHNERHVAIRESAIT